MNIFDHCDEAWFSVSEGKLRQGGPISLVTIQLNSAAEEGALQFLEASERRIFEEWTTRGTLLMAFVSHDRRELNLLIASNAVEARIKAEDIPSVASELADVQVRAVTALTMSSQGKLVVH